VVRLVARAVEIALVARDPHLGAIPRNPVAARCPAFRNRKDSGWVWTN
jgi:hypothetical protein